MGISWRYHGDIPKTSIISPIMLTIPLKTLFWSEFDHWKCQWLNWTEPQNPFCCWVARLDNSIFWWLGHDCVPHSLPWLMSPSSLLKLQFYWAILYFLLVVHTRLHNIAYIYNTIEGSLEVKLPTIWTDEKQKWEDSEKRRRSKKRKFQKKEDPGARKVRKVAKHCVFSMICGSGGSKSRHYLWGRSIFPNQTTFDATNKKAGNFEIIREVDNLMDSGWGNSW